MDFIKVSIGIQNDIEWRDGIKYDYKLDNESVDIWRINISSNLALVDDFFKLLLPDEIVRANRYVQKKDRIRFVISRGVLRCLISMYTHQPATVIKFVVSANKKPCIQHQNLKYNISHAGDWIIIAISNNEVGVDTEEIDQLFSYKEILADNFSSNEINYIAHQNTAAGFFLLWTRKEALTKATAQGLDDNLKYIPCLNGDHEISNSLLSSSKNWRLISFKPDADNIATVATAISKANMRYWDADFERLLPCFK